MTNIKIRKAQKNDYPEICSLINNELGYPNVDLENLSMRMDMMDKDKNYDTFVAVLDDKVVGFIGIVQGVAFEMNGVFMRIIALAVSKEYQNKGVGGTLIKHIEEYAKSRGMTILMFNSGFHRLDAHIFYERNDYEKKSYGFSKDLEKG